MIYPRNLLKLSREVENDGDGKSETKNLKVKVS